MKQIPVDEMSLRLREVAAAEPGITCDLQVRENLRTKDFVGVIQLHGTKEEVLAAMAFLQSGAKAAPGYEQ